MISIKQAVIVEGRYDKIKLSSILDTVIIETGGFRVFKDKQRQNLIRQIAKKRGIIIMTDSDSAGFVIRNFLKGIVPQSEIKNCYIPQIHGKEKRKESFSKEGFLGVEGVDEDVILDALKKCGAEINGISSEKKACEIKKFDLFELGLTGCDNSANLRKMLLQEMNLPAYLTTNAFLTAINTLYTLPEIKEKLASLSSKK